MEKTRRQGFFKMLIGILLALAALQAVREVAAAGLSLFIPGRAADMAVTAALALALSVWTVRHKGEVPVFPKRFTKGYLAASILFAGLCIGAPANFINGLPAVLNTLYGSVATPVYEELLFRGWVWEKAGRILRKGSSVFLLNVLLFTLWHAGYMFPQMMAGDWAAVAMKMAAGAGYGLLLGLIRLKAGNCYAGMLAHGLANLFMV